MGQVQGVWTRIAPMRGLVQRVARAEVRVDGEVLGAIGPGLCVLVGVTHADDAKVAARLAEKIWNLRIMAGEDGVMDRPVAEAGGELLVVSQFTLYGDPRKGRRPSFVDAAPPAVAVPLYERFLELLSERAPDRRVQTGEFGAMMQVELVNDGPVTLLLER